MIVLPESKDRMIVSSFVCTKHRTDRRTDRSAVVAITAVGIASTADALWKPIRIWINSKINGDFLVQGYIYGKILV